MRYAGLTDEPARRKREHGNPRDFRVMQQFTSETAARQWERGECGPKDRRQIPAAKAGNMAIPFQSEVSALSSNRTIKYTCNVTRTSASQFSGISSHHRRGKSWPSRIRQISSTPLAVLPTKSHSALRNVPAVCISFVVLPVPSTLGA